VEKERLKWDLNTIFGFSATILIYIALYNTHYRLSVSWLPFVAILSNPWKYKSDTYSLWGGMASTGNIYSLLGLFQTSKQGHSYALFGIIQISAGDAWSVLGPVLFQVAGKRALSIFGFSLYQSGATAAQICGISVYKIGSYEVEQRSGFSIFQTAPHVHEGTLSINIAHQYIAVSKPSA